LFASRGIHTVYNDEAGELNGDGKVESVVTKSGRILPCDFAVAGIGVYPDTSYLDGSSLKLDNGVVVDEYLRTNEPDVFAAGDIANFYDNVFQRHRRIEHWDNAVRQGKHVAGNMVGGNEVFHHTSYFYSKVFDTTLECFGDFSDYDELVTRGSFENKSVAVLYLKEGVLNGAYLQGRPVQERSAISRLISERKQLAPVQSRLADENFELGRALAA